ncbi:MAG: DUF3160 domain-containing protein, partial [Candidatus Adiutrix sp.]|nr:DUF3160 domain-containing protein [Candidatus Adiutrix sp.]
MGVRLITPVLVWAWLAAALALWSGPALAEPETVPLRLAPASNLASPPPAAAEAVKPAFKDKNFPLREAVNLKEIYELIGPLSPAQEKFLEENRFLLLAKPFFLMSQQPGEQPPADEMLANFDRLGGALAPARRAPQNARFVGPDIILHAWNKYLETRVPMAEAGPLRESLSALLAGLYENAAALRAEAGRPASADWERLMAQLAVARILVDTDADDPGSEALANFEPYRPAFSETMARKIRAELSRIYQGEGREPSQLGLTPAGGEALVDYAWFAPPAGSPAGAGWRAYFRAQVWLGRLGWDSRTEVGLADALNWALAMSLSRQAGAGEEAGGGQLPAAWARLTAITSFLSGYADLPGYREWLPFLMKEAGVSEFTADTSSDREVLARLKAAGPWPLVSGPFRELRPTAGRGVVCLLPLRRSLPELVEAGLISPGRRPELYSGLWPPVLLGHEGAKILMDRQVALTRPRAGGGGPEKTPDPPATTALAARLAQLSASLLAEPESAWFSSLLAEEWRLLTCL